MRNNEYTTRNVRNKICKITKQKIPFTSGHHSIHIKFDWFSHALADGSEYCICSVALTCTIKRKPEVDISGYFQMHHTRVLLGIINGKNTNDWQSTYRSKLCLQKLLSHLQNSGHIWLLEHSWLCIKLLAVRAHIFQPRTWRQWQSVCTLTAELVWNGQSIKQ